MLELRTTGGLHGRAQAVSADGRTVVGYETLVDGNGNGTECAFRWVSNPADSNGDGFLTGDDYDQFAGSFEAGDAGADLNADGFVNGDDYDTFASAFDAGC